jgi:glutamate N-acetyltransferase/amino-acid N-acetyltransferase
MSLTKIEGGITAAKGFTAAGIHCGIRKNKEKYDLALVYSADKCAAAGVYTQNKVKGAPIDVTKNNIADGYAKAVVVNSGIANTCNADGIEKAEKMCEVTAAALGIDKSDVVVASTGVIGEPLKIEPIADAMPKLVSKLSKSGNSDAASAIMTTDTHKKEYAVSFELGGKKCALGGMCKGSGMIHPNMATMLCFITTDVAISPKMLQCALSSVVEDTFNMVSVDGDTSTNDMVSLLASGKAGNEEITAKGEDYSVFYDALLNVMTVLSKEIAGDGEGATKLIECTVLSANSKENAKKIAKSVICSSLFKAAIFGSDANWGRVLCAIGYVDGEFSVDKVEVVLSSNKGEILVCQNGKGVPFSEEKAKEILLQKEVKVKIDMGEGDYSATAWGCDLTYDYVKINGDYRS